MEFEKVIALLRALRTNQVHYVLVGALGMTVHGIVRATQDVDLFILPEEENVSRLRAALRAIYPEDTAIDEISAQDLAGSYPAVRYVSPDGVLVIDIISRLGTEFSYQDLGFEEKVFEGVTIRVATPRTLYNMKKGTVRLQDRADAEALKELIDSDS